MVQPTYVAVLTADEALAHALLTVVVQLRRAPLADAVDRGSLQVLSELALHGPARPSSIATALRLDLSTVSRHVRSLEDDALVERSPDPTDARAQSVGVLPAGLLVLERAFRARSERIATATRDWSGADREHITNLLTRLGHDLQPRALNPQEADPEHPRKEHL